MDHQSKEPIAPIEEGAATGEVAEIYENIKRGLQVPFVPNIDKVLAVAPSALKGTWGVFENVLLGSSLPIPLRAMILYSISNANRCQYCGSIHKVTCRSIGVDEHTLAALDSDLAALAPVRVQAIVKFGVKCAMDPHNLSEADYEEVRAQGISDAEMVEIIALAALGNYLDTIADALRFAKEFGLDIVIGGGRDAWKVADLLAASDVPVLLGPVLAMPREEWDPYDAPFVNPSILQDAGVQFAFRSRSSSAARNLPYQAGMAVAFGLSEDDAMVALTGGAAEILGLEKQIGRLEEGLRADLIVTDGSPLQITTAMKMLVIGGREVSLETKHTQLYERYRSRLKDPGQSSK